MSNLSLRELYEQGRYTDVVALAGKADIHPASDPPNSFIVAASLLQLGHLEQCRQICVALSSVLANNPLFLSLHATCLRRLGQLDQSAVIFEQALKQYPDLPYLNNNYANLLIEQGKFDAAHRILSSVLERHPTYKDAAANLQRLKGLAALPGQATRPAGRAQKLEVPPSAAAGSAAEPTPAAPEPAAATTSAAASGATPADPSAESATPQRVGGIVDPLALAFSEEELQVEQQERLKRKAEVAARPAKGAAPAAQESLVSLPPVPTQELQDELAKAGVEALVEKQPEAALLLADLLNSLGPEGRREALKIAADAYLMLKRYHQAEITLLSLAASGTKLNAEQLLNMASLAINRQDAAQANQYIEQARKLDALPDHIEAVNKHLSKLTNREHSLTFHPYKQAVAK